MMEFDEICTVCKNRYNNKYYKINERMFNFNESFDYLHCSKCGTLQLKSQIENISYYYPKSYGGFVTCDQKTSFIENCYHRLAGIILLKLHTGFVRKKIMVNNDYNYLRCLMDIKTNKNSAILDVGCGSGEWLEKLSDIGFKNITGIDLYNVNKLKAKRKWNFISGEIFDIKDIKFDIIVFHHSFEHMKDPVKVLTKVKELLNTNGVCIIRIPVMGKYAWKVYKENWVQIDAPRHLYLYTVKAIKYLSRQAGLSLRKVIYDSDEFQFWGSEVYANRNISLEKAKCIKDSLFSKKTMNQYKKIAENLNKNKDGDQAIFYFYKSNKNKKI